METRTLDVVLKTSKLCNLRCVYCYEFNELHQRNRLSLADLGRILEKVQLYVARRDSADGMRTITNFIWHGGEPFLIEPEYYRKAIAKQRSICEQQDVTNSFQTNLTVLNEDIVDLIRSFDIKLGVSFDVFGGLRRNIAGRDSQARVIHNMQKLRDCGIRFGCITVLTAANLGREAAIFNFFESTGTSFRVLPLFEGAFVGQHDQYEISHAQILRSLKAFADLWLTSERTIAVTPVTEYCDMASRYVEGTSGHRFYDKRRWLPVLLVNTNGDCYGYGDPYGSPQYRYGNLIHDSFESLLQSDGFNRSAEDSRRRMAYSCTTCRYFGYCDGYPTAEGHSDNGDVNILGIRECHVVKDLFAHLVDAIKREPRPAGNSGQAQGLGV